MNRPARLLLAVLGMLVMLAASSGSALRPAAVAGGVRGYNAGAPLRSYDRDEAVEDTRRVARERDIGVQRALFFFPLLSGLLCGFFLKDFDVGKSFFDGWFHFLHDFHSEILELIGKRWS